MHCVFWWCVVAALAVCVSAQDDDRRWVVELHSGGVGEADLADRLAALAELSDSEVFAYAARRAAASAAAAAAAAAASSSQLAEDSSPPLAGALDAAGSDAAPEPNPADAAVQTGGHLDAAPEPNPADAAVQTGGHLDAAPVPNPADAAVQTGGHLDAAPVPDGAAGRAAAAWGPELPPRRPSAAGREYAVAGLPAVPSGMEAGASVDANGAVGGEGALPLRVFLAEGTSFADWLEGGVLRGVTHEVYPHAAEPRDARYIAGMLTTATEIDEEVLHAMLQPAFVAAAKRAFAGGRPPPARWADACWVERDSGAAVCAPLSSLLAFVQQQVPVAPRLLGPSWRLRGSGDLQH